MPTRARLLREFRSSTARWPQRAFGLFGYAAGGALVPTLILFCCGALPSFSMERGANPTNIVASAAIDMALVGLFGAQHSLMARAGIKRALDKVFGPDLQRSGYVLCACFALLPIFFAWRPLPRVLWDLPHARSLCQFGFVIGVLTVYGAAFALDHFELLGLRQAWFGSAPSATATLNISGPYRIVRHPLMTGLLLLFWSTSRMTVGHFCFAAAMTTYVLLGTHFEERDLRRRFGHAYADYQASTPMFLPWPVRRRRQLVAEAIRENHSSHD